VLSRPGPAVPADRRRLLASRPGLTMAASAPSRHPGPRRRPSPGRRPPARHRPVGDRDHGDAGAPGRPVRDGVVMSHSRMDTRPDEGDVTQPTLGPVGMLRWAWRQLTSMRPALFLLLLLAIGAVPGSIWPQRNIDAGRVADYLERHESTGPWLDRLGFFDVYSSPWFAAIYLLLFVSLVGCVVPRSRLHWSAMRARPPGAPRNLVRLPVHTSWSTEQARAELLDSAVRELRRRHYR